MSALFDLHEGAAPLILSFPHSGTHIPEPVAKKLTPAGRAVADTDWHVPRLYAFAKALDVTWIEAKTSRTVIDLNRDPYGASLYPGQTTTGLCPHQSFEGEALWLAGQAPDATAIDERLHSYFWPFHTALAAQIERLKARHGFCVLYDCHSIRGRIDRLFAGTLPSLNLGTNNGRSCAPDLQEQAMSILRQSDFDHVLNGHFRGGWITRHYGQPDANVHALQMEIAQRAYMDEAPPWRWVESHATRLRTVLQSLLQAVAGWQQAKRPEQR